NRCGCLDNVDCPSLVCSNDNSQTCVSASEIIYVGGAEADDSSPTCGEEPGMPCATIARGLERASEGVGAPVIYLADGEYTEEVTITQSVRIVGQSRDGVIISPGAVTTAGVTVNTAAIDVFLETLTIDGVEGGSGVFCTQGALTLEQTQIRNGSGIGGEASATCTLRIMRSLIQKNALGGLSIRSSSPFSLINNIIHMNGTSGSGGSEVGGLLFLAAASGSMHFNTIVDNTLSVPTGRGARCNTDKPGVINASHNLVQGSSNADLDQLAGVGCAWTYSAVGTPDIEGVPDGNNIDADCMPNPAMNGQLPAESPCIDGGAAASPAVDPPVDIDILGNPRPSGSNYDIGVFEAQRE
ncbi:MAG: choice-of-anchor Q domain-containing protein, partial [Myxococcota bacterium]